MGRQQQFVSARMRIPAVAVAVLAIASSAGPAVAQAPGTPETVETMPAQAMVADQSVSLDLSRYFSDPDGDALAYAAIVSNVTVAAASVSGSILTLAGVAPGAAVVTVLASDPDGLSVTQSTQVTVEAANQAPEPIGTVPGQNLAAGEWASINVSSYFRDPDGDALSYSATISNEAIAEVGVSGNTLTITQVGTGTVIVNVIARDAGGLATQQSMTVAVNSGQVTPTAALTEPAPPEPQRVEREPQQPDPTRPNVATVEVEASNLSAAEVRQPDPFPPRLLTGYVGSTGYTLAKGQGYVAAGYAGASPVAQLGDFQDAMPFVAHASYGVTDDLTVALGSALFYYNVESADTDLFPYVAPKFRVLSNEQVSVAVDAYVGRWLAEQAINYYGGSVTGSIDTEAIGLHVTGGMLGLSSTIFGETLTENVGTLAIGADFRVPSLDMKLVGQFRRIGFEDGGNVVTGGLRFLFLGAGLAGEAGVASHLENNTSLRPIVSVAYRF